MSNNTTNENIAEFCAFLSGQLPMGTKTPKSRGSADAYYGRDKHPHYYVDDKRITDLTPEQVAEYNHAYDNQDDRKDWGWDE
jgi:hypothetical protein